MKAALTVCSNGYDPEREAELRKLTEVLFSLGVETVVSPHVFAVSDEYSASDEERAEDLMRFYRDESVDVIFDISGGDLANGVLKYLDYGVIAASDKEFWGYSDLTSVINAVYAKTGKSSVLYSVVNLIRCDGHRQKERFRAYLQGNEAPLFTPEYTFLQGNTLSGIVVGGNIRCFLKLAGTAYWPDLKDKILLLESLGGESGRISTMLNQLDQTGAFQKIAGVVLGTFTEYEKAGLKLSVYDLLKKHIPPQMPVIRTRDVGHGPDDKAVRIGAYYSFGTDTDSKQPQTV